MNPQSLTLIIIALAAAFILLGLSIFRMSGESDDESDKLGEKLERLRRHALEWEEPT